MGAESLSLHELVSAPIWGVVHPPLIGTLRGLSKGSLEGSSWNAPLIPRPPTLNHNRQTHWHRAHHMPPTLDSEL